MLSGRILNKGILWGGVGVLSLLLFSLLSFSRTKSPGRSPSYKRHPYIEGLSVQELQNNSLRYSARIEHLRILPLRVLFFELNNFKEVLIDNMSLKIWTTEETPKIDIGRVITRAITTDIKGHKKEFKVITKDTPQGSWDGGL